MKVQFSENGWEQFMFWLEQDKKTLKKRLFGNRASGSLKGESFWILEP